MKRISALVVTLGIAAASLSSCSRSNYAFNTTAPAYLGSEKVQAAAPTEDAATASITIAAPSLVEATPVHQAATTLAHHSASAAAMVSVPKTSAPVAANQKVQLTKAERKALRSEVKSQLAAAPKATKASGKSQVVALVLSILLGGLGIDRFYLGYTGIGILKLLTGGVFGILYIIDIVRIAIGDLKPKNGEYEKTL